MLPGVHQILTRLLFYFTFCIFFHKPAVVPHPRGDEDGPGTGGPTPEDQAGPDVEPT